MITPFHDIKYPSGILNCTTLGVQINKCSVQNQIFLMPTSNQACVNLQTRA
uniref:Uncharacterized protein n=1 Tax=Rhizophora mucronata TaxID=61149 RepID=A0A2P2QVX3_RHIMU